MSPDRNGTGARECGGDDETESEANNGRHHHWLPQHACCVHCERFPGKLLSHQHAGCVHCGKNNWLLTQKNFKITFVLFQVSPNSCCIHHKFRFLLRHSCPCFSQLRSQVGIPKMFCMRSQFCSRNVSLKTHFDHYQLP